MQENMIAVNIADTQAIDVYWQDEVVFDLDVHLMWVRSGQQEISKYVSEVSLPKIEDFANQKMQDYRAEAEKAAVSAKEAMTEAQKQAENAAINCELAAGSAAQAAESVNQVADKTKQSLQEIADYADTLKTKIDASAETAKTSIQNAADEYVGAAKENLNDYVEQTLEPEMQVYIGKAQNQADTAAASAAAAAESAAKVADSLKDKADIDAGNFSVAGKNTITTLGTPDYNSGITLTFSKVFTNAGESKTMAKSGLFCFEFLANNVISTICFYVNNRFVGKIGNSQTSLAFWDEINFPVTKGDVVKVTAETVGGFTAAAVESYLFPYKGSMYE